MENGTETLLRSEPVWFIEIIIGLCVLVIINYVFKKAVKHVRQRSLSIKSNWKEKLDHIFFLPIHVMLWVLGGILVVEVLGRRFGFSFFESYLSPFRTTAVVCCLAWVFLRWTGEGKRYLLGKEAHNRKVDAAFVHVLGKLLTIVIVLITAMIILQVWGLNIGPLIAFGGIGAAAVGFAGKDVIANFFGGLMLYITRPFVAGDYIILSSPTLEGYVEDIGWYLTSVRDKQKRPVYLPNAIFSNTMVVNHSRMSHRHIDEKIGIRYKDFSKMEALIGEIRTAIASHPQVDAHLPILVFFTGFGPYSLDICVDFYTLETRQDRYMEVRQQILMLVYKIIASKEADMPSPPWFSMNLPQ